MSTPIHALFEIDSHYMRLRGSFRLEDKMRGYLHYLKRRGGLTAPPPRGYHTIGLRICGTELQDMPVRVTLSSEGPALVTQVEAEIDPAAEQRAVRLFFLDPTILRRMQERVPAIRTARDLFVEEHVRHNFDVARVLSALPEMAGMTKGSEVALRKDLTHITVGETATFPPEGTVIVVVFG